MPVAIKRIRSYLLEVEGVAEEFEQEVKFMRNIRHPNIGTVTLSSGQLTPTSFVFWIWFI